MSVIQSLKAERDKLKANAKTLVRTAEAEKRDLTPVESIEFRAIEDDLEAIESRIEEIEDLNSRNGERHRLAAELHPDPLPESQRQYRVTGQPEVYGAESRHSFFLDMVAAERGDYEARGRLDQHRAETRDIGTGALGALVPPAYLPQQYAQYLRAGRVTANLATRLPLPPEGMAIHIPRGTTGTVVAAQTSENQSVTEVDFDETTLTVDVRTYAGMQDLSRQSIDRGHLVDRVIYADLIGAYNQSLDTDVIAGPGTGGRHAGIVGSAAYSVTFSTTDSVAAFYGAVANAGQQIASGRYMAPDVIVMHPRRWGWLAAKVDADGRPLIDLDGHPSNAMGNGNAPGEGAVGSIAGIPVYLDANVPTTISSSTFSGSTEDLVIVGVRGDWLLWEDEGGTPQQFRFDDVGSGTLTSRLVVAGYSAFSAGWHPAGTAIISGSYLTTPTF